MPQLPTYDSQASYSTQSVGPRMDRSGVKALGAMATFGESVSKIADQWLKAEVTGQYTTAKNSRDLQMMQLMEDAENEVDHTKKQDYIDRIEAIRKQEVTINDVDVQAQYDSEKEFSLSKASIEINSAFRQKGIVHQRGQIVVDGKATKKNYLNSRMQGERDFHTHQWKNRLESYRDTGFITEAEYQSELEGMAEWEYDRAMGDIGKSPSLFAQRVAAGEYSLGEKDLNELSNIATASAKRQDKIKKITQLETHVQNEGRSLYGYVDEDNVYHHGIVNDPNMPMSEKLKKLRLSALEGTISKEFSREAISYLTSEEEAASNSSSEKVAMIVRLMYQANEAKEDGGHAMSYLEKVKKIQLMIADKRSQLTEKDRIRLQKELNTITKKKGGEAIQDVKRATVKGTRQKLYQSAIDHFENSLDTHLRDEAFMQYWNLLNEIEDDKTHPDHESLKTPEGKLKIARRVEFRIKSENNKRVMKKLDDYDSVRERVAKERPELDIHLEQTEDGEFIYGAYDKETGKRIGEWEEDREGDAGTKKTPPSKESKPKIQDGYGQRDEGDNPYGGRGRRRKIE